MNSSNLSKRELETMNLFWEKDHSLTAHDIQNNMGLSVNSVQSTLRRLLEKEMIFIETEIVKGRVLARCYKPTICKKDYDVEKIINKISKMKINDISPSCLTASFLAMEKIEIKLWRKYQNSKLYLKNTKTSLTFYSLNVKVGLYNDHIIIGKCNYV